MNRKQLTIVLVLGVVLGGLGWWVVRRDAASYQSTGAGLGQKLLPDFPLNDVGQVVLTEGTNELTLARVEEVWKVRERYDYPANFSQIGDFLRKMWDLKVVQSEPVGTSQLARLQLLEPGKAGTNGGTLVEFKNDSGKAVASVLLGKKHMKKGDSSSPFGGEGYPAGRYVLVPSNAKQVALISDALSDVEPKPDRWLNKDFFKVEKLKTVVVTHAVATNSWKLYREIENGELKLADPQGEEKLDTGKSSSAGSALSYPSFVDVVSPQAKAEETGLDQPITAKLETFEGFTYTVKIGKKTGEDNHHFAVSVAGDFAKERTPGQDEKAEDKEKLDKEFKEKLTKLEEKLKTDQAFAKWTYLVSKWTIDALLKERKDLLVEKKEDKKDGAAAADAKPDEPPTALPEPDADEDGAMEEPK
jgi:hypothetical protein